MIGEYFMTPEEALHKMMRHNNDEKPEKLDLRAIILGAVICLLCFALPLALLWIHKVMKVTSGVGKF
ncbi:MAG: hypothetical protein GY834_15555 [Bacteroidetes bacterium]|nr:hypothetical protein [Bacteroidota bacterium]